MSIHLKPNVIIDHRTHPKMFDAMFAIDRICMANYGVNDTTVTSGLDGKHGKNSLHPKGMALDFRVHHWPTAMKDTIFQDIKAQLGREYDCLLEAIGTPNEHLHVEYDPK